MPGKKYASIKDPKSYEGLKRAGYSKTSAARISNWMAGRGKDSKGRGKGKGKGK